MAKTAQPRLGVILDEMLGESVTVQTPNGASVEVIKRLMARRLINIALRSKNEKVAIEAIREVKEYTEGRTPIRLLGTGDHDESLTDLEITVVPSGPAKALPESTSEEEKK